MVTTDQFPICDQPAVLGHTAQWHHIKIPCPAWPCHSMGAHVAFPPKGVPSCFLRHSSFGAKSPNDIFRLQRAPCIKIQTDSSKPLLRINHYPINKEAIQGIKPIIKDYKTQGFIISCTSP